MNNQSLTDPEYLQEFLRQHRLTPERSAGQNFLVCQEPLEAMIAAMEGAGQNVTELGAGLGTATGWLAAAGFRVRAIERDPSLAQLLLKQLPPKLRDAVELHQEDLREASWEWTEPWQLVGNIPYNLSGYIIRRLTELPSPPTQALLLVQREVAERLAAGAGTMNLLGLAAQLWGTVHLLMQVPASCFLPAPAVESTLVLLAPAGAAGLPREKREAVLKTAKPFFQQKRKQMGGTLRRMFTLTPEACETALQTAGIAPAARPQEVSVEQWVTLAEAL